MTNNWTIAGQLITDEEYTKYVEDGYIGFVYVITNTITGMKYIGKKLWVTKKKMPPLKGKKRKRSKMAETDWRDYYGSSEEVKVLVTEIGKDKFQREIIHLCKSKGELSYLEVYEQITNKVLLLPDIYYNSFIGCKIHRDHVKRLHNDNH